MKSEIEIALIHIMDAVAGLPRTSVNRYQGTNIYKMNETNHTEQQMLGPHKLAHTVNVGTCDASRQCGSVSLSLSNLWRLMQNTVHL